MLSLWVHSQSNHSGRSAKLSLFQVLPLAYCSNGVRELEIDIGIGAGYYFPVI